MATGTKNTKHVPTLEPGWWVALTLKPGTAPIRSYVGTVEAIDAHGIRITLINWLLGMAAGNDLFVPWANLDSALVCTDRHDQDLFGRDAERWQEDMCKKDEPSPVEAKQPSED